MENVNRTFLPAAGHDWALPLYDPFVKLLGGDKARHALILQATLPTVGRVLDVGCGTGTLAVLLKQLYPKVDVVGLDPDPKALGRAGRKAKRASVSIHFDQGSADRLPYADGSFDRVLSSFMFHHLRPDQRMKMLQEASRVLVPGGSLHLLDFERPEDAGVLGRLLYSNHHLDDNQEQRILALLQQAGFTSREKITTDGLLFDLLRMGYYRAKVKETASTLTRT
jgi:ubiquinone/menaquinone biosynthesis C-methylase UbiE